MAAILLVEDEAALRMLILDTLEDEGYAIDTACDGEEALALLATKPYDLVILDNMMPKMSGIDLIERYRALPAQRAAKTLMLSAKSQRSDQEMAYRAGADAFMSKPFSPLELIARVEAMLHG